MHTMNQDLSKLCYYFYLRMKLESTVLVLRILMIITILHSIEYRNVLFNIFGYGKYYIMQCCFWQNFYVMQSSRRKKVLYYTMVLVTFYWIQIIFWRYMLFICLVQLLIFGNMIDDILQFNLTIQLSYQKLNKLKMEEMQKGNNLKCLDNRKNIFFIFIYDYYLP